jgi:twinkle protein
MNLTRAQDCQNDVLELYRQGLPKGESTGWVSVDKHYTVLPGMLTVVTGWPGSGKSEWVDALTMNLAEKGWRFLMASFENQPTRFHLAKLLEKHVRLPFGNGPTQRMTEDQITEAMEWVNKHYGFLDYESAISVPDVLEAAMHWQLEGNGKCGLVIDPWNELEHARPTNQTETEYISDTLRRLRRFARSTEMHVWIVAHPQKLQRDQSGKLPIPRPDSISGSQHWWNKADYAVTVHRDQMEGSQEVEIHVQKVRWKHTGQVGFVTLKYDRVTGRYNDSVIAIDQYRRAV